MSQECYRYMFVSCVELFFFWDIPSTSVLLNVNTNCEHSGQCRDDFIWGHLHERGKRKRGLGREGKSL